ncbi:GIY-YIG nuclease family protein [Scytonema millei]|uniref:GIY-YIG nuclease family protein n=1 Tax=Scytonema millei VB511283 TaxID=1245923 RepID=A0A9X5E5D4_9CYAN|nr:GIY-YIG nuclease family protein [Scytonema millei]NHC35331.1 GIY-YIG nuclease family protein [Scytonema millei VB511283]
MSYIYLICFSASIGNSASKFGSARHYLGYTSTSLHQRLEQHRSGRGAKICRAAAIEYGRELNLVRYWRNGTRALERELKRRNNPKECDRNLM